MRFTISLLAAAGLSLAGCGGYDDDTTYETPARADVPAADDDDCVPRTDDAAVGDVGYDDDGDACTLDDDDLADADDGDTDDGDSDDMGDDDDPY
jgi:hypothetical protein